MGTYGWVSIQPSQPKQAILRTGFDFNVFFSGFFTVSACPVAYAPLDLMHKLDKGPNRDIYFNETTFRLELELLVDQIIDVTLT